jgi:hypothetical protein
MTADCFFSSHSRFKKRMLNFNASERHLPKANLGLQAESRRQNNQQPPNKSRMSAWKN